MQITNMYILWFTKRIADPSLQPQRGGFRSVCVSSLAAHTGFLGKLDVARELARVGEDHVVGQVDPDGGRCRAAVSRTMEQ